MAYQRQLSSDLKDWIAINSAMERSSARSDVSFGDSTADSCSAISSVTLNSCPSPATTCDTDPRAPSPSNALFIGVGYNAISTIFSFTSSQNWQRSSCVIPPGCLSSTVDFNCMSNVSSEGDNLDFKTNLIEFPSLKGPAQVSFIDQRSLNCALTIQDASCGYVLDKIAFFSHHSYGMFQS